LAELRIYLKNVEVILNGTLAFSRLKKSLSREEKRLLDKLIIENRLKELKHTMVEFLQKYGNVIF